MRLHRLLGIILLLESRGVMKACQLAYALETSERTIYRDMDILCESGLPIQSIPGPSGGYCFMKGYASNIGKLNCDDIINLFLSGIGVRPAEYTENAVSLRNSILKLEKSIPDEYLPDVEKAKRRFYFDPSPWWHDITPSPKMDIIRKALWGNRKLRLDYTKNSGAGSTRIFRPYGLAVKNSEWYLIGFCENRNRVIGLKCDRIRDAVQLDEKYAIPEDFSLENFWRTWVNEFKQETIQKTYGDYPVKIMVRQEKLRLLKGYAPLDMTDGDACKIVTINMLSYDIACYELFKISDQLEVLYPEELRRFICHKAACIAATYERCRPGLQAADAPLRSV